MDKEILINKIQDIQACLTSGNSVFISDPRSALKCIDSLLNDLKKEELFIDQSSTKSFKCPECKSDSCWFDRTISYYINENGIEEEDGMHMRCTGCGKTFEELFPEEVDQNEFNG